MEPLAECPICGSVELIVEHSTRAETHTYIMPMTNGGTVPFTQMATFPTTLYLCNDCQSYQEGWLSDKKLYICRIGVSVSYGSSRVWIDDGHRLQMVNETRTLLNDYDNTAKGLLTDIGKNPDDNRPKLVLRDYLMDTPRLRVPRTRFVLENLWMRTTGSESAQG